MIREIDLPIGDKPLINSVVGTIPGTLTRLTQAPKHAVNAVMGGYNLLQSLYNDPDSLGAELPRIPQEAFKAVKESYPSAKSIQKSIGLDRSGYYEKLADKSLAGGLEWLAMGGNPGGWTSAGKKLLKYAPIVGGGLLASDVLKPLGPTAQTVGQLGTMAALPWMWKGLGAVASKLPGIASQFGKQAVEGTIPLAKEVGKVFTEEQKLALKQIKEHEKKLAQNAKISAKEQAQHQKNLEVFREENLATRQQELETQRFKQKEMELKAKEHKDLMSEVESYNAENAKEQTIEDVTAQKGREQALSEQQKQQIKLQNQIEKLNAEADSYASKGDAANYKTKLKEAEELESQRTKFNEENIPSETKIDAEVLKRREQTKNAVDKYQAENDALMSKQDAEALKAKIDAGEQITLPQAIEEDINKARKELETGSEEVENLKTLEDVVSETFGAKPKELRTRMSNLYKSFRDSFSPETKTSAKKMQAVNSLLKESIEEGIPTSSKDLILKEVIQPIESKIQNGQISVRDLAAIRQDINEKIREIYKKNGSLERFEKNLPRFNHTIDEMLEVASKENPEMKLGNFKEANKIARNMSQTSNAARWAQQSIQTGKLGRLWRVIGDPILYANNPQVSKWFNRAVRKYTAGEIKTATKNLIIADKVAAKSLEEESTKSINIGKTLGKVAPIAQEGKVIEFNI
jgi:myosin heavy subunit